MPIVGALCAHADSVLRADSWRGRMPALRAGAVDRQPHPFADAIKAGIYASLVLCAFFGLRTVGLSSLASAVAVIATAAGIGFVDSREA